MFKSGERVDMTKKKNDGKSKRECHWEYIYTCVSTGKCMSYMYIFSSELMCYSFLHALYIFSLLVLPSPKQKPVSTPATTSTVMFNPLPTTPEGTTSPPAEGLQLSIILPTILGGLLLVVVFILLILIVTVIKLRKKKHPATAEGLRKKAKKLEKLYDKKVKKLSHNPDKRRLQEERIAHINQEIKNLQAQATTIRQENYGKARGLSKEAAELEEEASKMEKALSSLPSQKMKESKKIIRNKRKEAENRYKQARCYDKLACDAGETEDGDKEGSGGLETDLGEDAICRSKTNPNSTIPQQETRV